MSIYILDDRSEKYYEGYDVQVKVHILEMKCLRSYYGEICKSESERVVSEYIYFMNSYLRNTMKDVHSYL